MFLLLHRYTQKFFHLICGYRTFAISLEFHHVDPSIKETEISKLVGKALKNQERLFNEISKCVVLCCNCHTALHNDLVKLPI